MRISAEFLNTGNIDVTLTITMTMRDWKSLRTSLNAKYPDWKLSAAIGEAIAALEGRVTALLPSPEEP